MVAYRLDEVFDAHTLTQVLLEVMPKCSRPTQQGILELLPELVLDSDCEVWPFLAFRLQAQL